MCREIGVSAVLQPVRDESIRTRTQAHVEQAVGVC